MTEPKTNPVFLPDPVREWVEANPLPTLITTDRYQTILANSPFADLAEEENLQVEELLGGVIRENAPSATTDVDLIKTLGSGECVVKILEMSRNRYYTLHLAKLALSEGECLACMLMPSEDPSQLRFTGILDDIACFVMELDSRGNVSYINEQLLNHLGYTTDDRGKLNHLKYLIDDYRPEKIRQNIQEVEDNGIARFRTEFKRQDEEALTMEVSIVESKAPDNSLFLLTARDITAQLEHEETLESALAEAELKADSARDENRRLRARLDPPTNGTQLIYRSKAFAEVMRKIHRVARTDATVLVTGETGTGKELVAKTIYEQSGRANTPLVTVDCGSLPPELIESELFGYRKGAFTGATKDRKGRFEIADGGTIFLDEIGELPLLMQTRMLRILQEGEVMPIGANKPITVDVRVIAATNRNLSQLVKEGKFRQDLFYRLNVFPIRTIPLRERKEDIYPLLQHFIEKFNDKFGKEISGVDNTTLERIKGYDFPGNVRQLENMVERAFVIADGQTLPLTVPQGREPALEASPVLELFDGTLTEFLSFDEYQRKYIQMVLDSTGGKVSGKGGAAEILKIHPQTLFSKMRKLGIRR